MKVHRSYKNRQNLDCKIRVSMETPTDIDLNSQEEQVLINKIILLMIVIYKDIFVVNYTS